MRKLDAVLWTGKNLEEVIEFVGKSRKFNDWFKSWEEYEKYVHEHGDVVKLFAPDGLSVDVLPGTWIVKTPEGFNVPMTNPWLKANKPEPQVLDDAAEEYAWGKEEPLADGERVSCMFHPNIDAFKAGAKWRDEQIQKLPDNLDEAAEEIVIKLVPTLGQKYDDGSYVGGIRDFFSREELIGLVIAGAKWMAEQGITCNGEIYRSGDDMGCGHFEVDMDYIYSSFNNVNA